MEGCSLNRSTFLPSFTVFSNGIRNSPPLRGVCLANNSSRGSSDPCTHDYPVMDYISFLPLIHPTELLTLWTGRSLYIRHRHSWISDSRPLSELFFWFFFRQREHFPDNSYKGQLSWIICRPRILIDQLRCQPILPNVWALKEIYINGAIWVTQQ